MNNRGEENEMSISVQNITKSFKDRQQAKERKLILKDISFDVSEGEFVPFGSFRLRQSHNI